jgi:hypothetical protein
MSDLLFQWLADRDTPCPGCGYNLRGLGVDRCPECNQGLVLQVGLAEPRLAGFLATVIALALGVGFSGLLLLYVAIVLARGKGGAPLGQLLTFAGAPFVVEGLALVLLLLGRRRFRRWPLGLQWACAAGGALLTLTNVTVFSFNIR